MNAGGPEVGACWDMGDQASCESAYHTGESGVAPCYWDGSVCIGCGYNAGSLDCSNTCVGCANGSLSNAAGGPGTSACHAYDGYPEQCEHSYHIAGSTGAATPCWYDNGSCNGCGGGNNGGPNCANTCDGCDNSSLKFFSTYEEGSGACQENTTQAACEVALHMGSNGLSPCYWDGSTCWGCYYEDCETSCDLPACEGGGGGTTPTGPPGAGSCCISNGTAGCEVQACQDCVCPKDSYCCNNQWDSHCADCASGGSGYNNNCYGACTGVCPCAN